MNYKQQQQRLYTAALTWLCLQLAVPFTIRKGPHADHVEACSLDVTQRLLDYLAIIVNGLLLLS
jgi:hypothetical protein